MDDPLLWLTGSDENWVDVEPFMSRAAGVWVAGKCHRAAGGFRACTDPLPAGLGFYFGFAAYTHEDAFELTCGPPASP